MTNLRIGHVLAIVMWVVWGGVIQPYLGEDRSFDLFVRYGMMIPLTTLSLALTFWGRYPRIWRWPMTATLLLTGLTRDGVYLVEDGAVVGEVNNFRFNESPVDLIGRFTEAGSTVPAFSREWGDYFPRVAAPALRVPDFNYSSVSEAS
jgi:hypothetical protein